MSMNLTTYVMIGYKTTRQDLEDQWPDAYETLLDDEPQGIVMVQSEGSDDVVIGHVLHKVDEYMGDAPAATELVFPSAEKVQQTLADVGIDVPADEINPYCYASWG